MKTTITRHRNTLFEIQTDQELSEETKEALKTVQGVEDALSFRYRAQFTVGPLFDISQVEKDVCALVQSQDE